MSLLLGLLSVFANYHVCAVSLLTAVKQSFYLTRRITLNKGAVACDSQSGVRGKMSTRSMHLHHFTISWIRIKSIIYMVIPITLIEM